VERGDNRGIISFLFLRDPHTSQKSGRKELH